MEWLRGTVSIWLPVLLGLATAVVGRSVLTAARLRRDLASDLELLKSLPSRSRSAAHLNRSVHGRVIRLVAQIRYPSFAAPDLLGLVTVLVSGSLNGTFAVALITGGVDLEPAAQKSDNLSLAIAAVSPLLLGVIAASVWSVSFSSWSRRAAQRFVFVREHLASDEIRDLSIVAQPLVLLMSVLSVTLVLVPPLVAVFVVADRIAVVSPPILQLVFVAGGVVAVWGMARFVGRSPLALVADWPAPLWFSRPSKRWFRRNSRAVRDQRIMTDLAQLIDTSRAGR